MLSGGDLLYLGVCRGVFTGEVPSLAYEANLRRTVVCVSLYDVTVAVVAGCPPTKAMQQGRQERTLEVVDDS